MVFGFCALTARTTPLRSKQNALLYVHEYLTIYNTLGHSKRGDHKTELASGKTLADLWALLRPLVLALRILEHSCYK